MKAYSKAISGAMAAALLAKLFFFGVISAILASSGTDLSMPEAYVKSPWAGIAAIVMYVALCAYLILHSMSAKKE